MVSPLVLQKRQPFFWWKGLLSGRPPGPPSRLGPDGLSDLWGLSVLTGLSGLSSAICLTSFRLYFRYFRRSAHHCFSGLFRLLGRYDPDGLIAQDILVEPEEPFDLFAAFRRARVVEDKVVALILLLDGVGELPSSPFIDSCDRAARALERGSGLRDDALYGILRKVGPDDADCLVLVHDPSLWIPAVMAGGGPFDRGRGGGVVVGRGG